MKICEYKSGRFIEVKLVLGKRDPQCNSSIRSCINNIETVQYLVEHKANIDVRVYDYYNSSHHYVKKTNKNKSIWLIVAFCIGQSLPPLKLSYICLFRLAFLQKFNFILAEEYLVSRSWCNIAGAGTSIKSWPSIHV